MKLDAKTYRRIRSIFHFGSEVVGKIPRPGDGILDVLAKLLAIADAGEKSFGGKGHVYADIFGKYDLRARASDTFVKLFFSTDVSSRFTVRRHGVSEHLELIEAAAADGERIFFQEFRHGRPELSDEFFHTPGFDFSSVTSALWEHFPHGLYLSMKAARWTNEVTFSPLHPPRGAVTSDKASARIEEGAAALRARAGEEPYCFLAFGPPGVGKTAYVSALARETGGRLLTIDATALPQLGVQEVGFLLDALLPDVLLVDDFDEAPAEAARARLRFLFAHLGASRRRITIAITVNDPAKLDAALLRSERIDEAVEFALPGHAERQDVIWKLFDALAPHLIDVDDPSAPFHLDDDGIERFEALTKATDGWNHADLGGLVGRLVRGETVEAALGAMTRLRDLAAKAAEAGKEAKPGAPDGSPPPG